MMQPATSSGWATTRNATVVIVSASAALSGRRKSEP